MKRILIFVIFCCSNFLVGMDDFCNKDQIENKEPIKKLKTQIKILEDKKAIESLFKEIEEIAKTISMSHWQYALYHIKKFFSSDLSE